MVEVLRRRISRLSLINRFDCSAFLDLSLKVAKILGAFHSMVPELHSRACLLIPDKFSSFLLDRVRFGSCV